MERCIILSARRYDFQDDSGKRVSGNTVTYLINDQGDGDQRGLAPLTINAAAEVWSQLEELPGVYDCEFRQRPGLKGRPTLQLTAVRLLDSLDFTKQFASS